MIVRAGSFLFIGRGLIFTRQCVLQAIFQGIWGHLFDVFAKRHGGDRVVRAVYQIG